jgi:hypothetical protein
MTHFPHCPHAQSVRTANGVGQIDVCLDCRRVKSPRGVWRSRIKADGVDSRWIVGMRRSLGLEPGPFSQPWK